MLRGEPVTGNRQRYYRPLLVGTLVQLYGSLQLYQVLYTAVLVVPVEVPSQLHVHVGPSQIQVQLYGNTSTGTGTTVRGKHFAAAAVPYRWCTAGTSSPAGCRFHYRTVGSQYNCTMYRYNVYSCRSSQYRYYRQYQYGNARAVSTLGTSTYYGTVVPVGTSTGTSATRMN